MKVRYTISSGRVGGDRSGTIEVDDDQTDAEIDEIVNEHILALGIIDWEKLPSPPGER